MRLEGKVALITGATAGIGAGIVDMFAREGARVAFTGRSKDKGAAVEARVRAAGGTALYIPADNTVEADIAAAVATTVDTYGSLTTLVNNAAATEISGGGADSSVADIDNEVWDSIIRTALYGAFWASKYSIPHMKTAGSGSIVNISASSSVLAIRTRPAYQASKGAINSLTRQLAIDYGGDDIRANAIIVGFINTGGDLMQKLVADEAYIGVIRDMVLLPRLGEPADIAAAAVYLSSDESKYVTGVLLPVDGGATSHQPVPPRPVRRD
jgi:NAD(P)-dependent dehydrogenase (short-subunit alcohol dehydrogenase family)